jgi:acetate kinase
MKILVVNAGSTSLKFRLFSMEDESILAEGRIERVGSSAAPFTYRLGKKENKKEMISCTDYRTAIEHAVNTIRNPVNGVLSSLDDLDAVGFKPVHAKNIADSVFITEEVISAMEEYLPLAPAHNPPYIKAFRIFQQLLPGKPLIGVFEPAFHKTIPDFAHTYSIPFEWSEKHAIRRYGFHGASHRYVSLRAPELADYRENDTRIISCHLGGSSSICAIKNSVSIETSMGFSPQSGLPHATRIGDLDPYILLYLMKKEALAIDELFDILATKGGLKGISGISGDIRDLENAASEGNARAELAIGVLVHETKKYIGAYTAVLEGLDILAFTGGIGENSTQVRERICTGLECLGISLDNTRNASTDRDLIISENGSPVKIVVVAANEELIVARESARLLLSTGK